MKYIYDLFFLIFAIFSLPKFFVRLNQAGSAKGLILERFGVFSKALRQKFSTDKIVWLHAVSVGEVMAARRWVQLFLETYPDWSIALSTTTPTGQQVARSLASDRVFVLYAPFDFSFVVKRVLDQMRPRMILLMETEIWPNLILHAHSLGIPIGVMNGRISPRSFQRYRWVRSWISPILGKLSFCFVQSKRDQDYFSKLGVSDRQIFYSGNMKFDQFDISNGTRERKDFQVHGVTQNGLIFIGGSTHWNEEALILRVFERLRKIFSDLQLILAPRHLEHLSKVIRVITELGLPYRLFSEKKSLQAYPLASACGEGEEPRVVVVDRMGVLGALYAVADLVFVGGSFVPRGGQSPIEPAFLKKPLLHGPNIFNFQEIYRTLDERQAALMIQSEEELFEKSKLLLESPELRGEMGARAWSSVQTMKGATGRTLDYLASWINAHEKPSVALGALRESGE